MSSSIFAEYALRYISKPMGVSEYKVTRTLPKELEETLSSEEDIQKSMQRDENK